ncbi:hypothetical protein Q7C_1138 [Methylophaga frappieri]|uniref:Uncharacterized protein n=1 Tax=Methylophaga frappieri (strain ATCC BAA-2434 / DSM 25690 / JAM7) TaxID=754477 RepID=I1YHA0_METFJ|nr:hypothetical protein [Methylophaga frappieri]AFJ02293.1 hypothetical protein Q7C_1138 [Methylophaga frappieri]
MEESRSQAGNPNWASILGVIAIMLGVFLTGMHGNELMKQSVIQGNMPASGIMPEADCPEEELEEEGLTLAECEYLVDHVAGIALAMPDWFPSAMMILSVAGVVLAFLSIIVGGALVNFTNWSVVGAISVFSCLAVIDLLQFAVVVNTGPILRDAYLWSVLLWLILHAMMVVGAIAGRNAEMAKG